MLVKVLPDTAMPMVGKLLEEVSWERATSYRQGGRGREDPLAERLSPGERPSAVRAH